MAEMDVLQSKIIQQIEAYLTEENLRNDYNLAKYEQENDGWIPVERLNHFNKLSTYKYETILNALRSKRSNIIELNLCEPAYIRRRRQPLKGPSIEQNPDLYQTVVVSGLPRDAKHEELFEFFNRFYPVDKIKMLPSSRTTNTFSGKLHLIFVKSEHAAAFVQRSDLVAIIYMNDYVLQLCNGYTLVCKMLVDCDDQDEIDLIKQTDQLRFRNGQSFAHRLANYPPRVSFNTTISLSKDDPGIEQSLFDQTGIPEFLLLVRPKFQSVPSQTKSCLKSSTCATEQILFCQNTTDKKLSKALEYQDQPIVFNRLSYEYYIPNHLLKQTCECMFIAALNPHCFTIQLKQDAVEFDKFQREINDFYNEIDAKEYFVTPEQIRLNLCVICADPKSSENDKIWNRSQILDFDSTDNTVNLFYVDLGTWDEYVPINRLRHLIDGFHRHLVFSLTCRLAHISPLNDNEENCIWPTDATDQFLAVIDQVLPEIELLELDKEGCFQTNLFVINSGQYVCVNDYMIHIKKAKPIVQLTNSEDSNQYLIRPDQISANSLTIHPVIALYNRSGETLKRSRPTTLVKLIHINPQQNAVVQDKLPLIFIHYQKTIFIPDFNICTLLKSINSNIDIDIIKDYALATQYQSVHITRECHSDIFTQIDSFVHLRSFEHIALYTIDFVRYILERHHVPMINLFLVLEQAKFAQIYASDLSLWFNTNNELASASNNSMKLNSPSLHTPPENEQNQPVKKRLLFSNRIISPT